MDLAMAFNSRFTRDSSSVSLSSRAQLIVATLIILQHFPSARPEETGPGCFKGGSTYDQRDRFPLTLLPGLPVMAGRVYDREEHPQRTPRASSVLQRVIELIFLSKAIVGAGELSEAAWADALLPVLRSSHLPQAMSELRGEDGVHLLHLLQEVHNPFRGCLV